ncbi:hypothetical protein ACQ27_gp419 [Klebsiella phage K64-1]|nr:hypothetical protein ACQ27_gp419 [Klebsiella phage K64-1]
MLVLNDLNALQWLTGDYING